VHTDNEVQKNLKAQVYHNKVSIINQEENSSNPLKIEVKRKISICKEDSASIYKNPLTTNNKKNYFFNNILYESVSNTSNIYNDSFFRQENFSKNILETEVSEINYVLTEANEPKKGKRIYAKHNESKKNRDKDSINFIQKVREALNFSNTIRSNHLISNKNNNYNNININFNENENTNKDIIKNTEASFYNQNNINNISISSKKENQGSGNNSKKLVNLHYLDSNTMVKDKSPISNMINEYFVKLESKQISQKIVAEKVINDMNNIRNNGANFISNNINNNFTNEKTRKGSEDINTLNQKELHNKLYEDAHINVSVSVDKNTECLLNPYIQNDFKSPQFGYIKKSKKIIKVKKSEDEIESHSDNSELNSFNAKNLNKTLAKMDFNKIFKDDAETNFKKKIKPNLNQINNINFNLPVSLGINSTRNKTLSFDADKMEFYLTEKNLKKINCRNRENFNEKNICVTNNYIKKDNNFIESNLRKQAELKKHNKETFKNIDANYLSSRSKTSKNISVHPVEQNRKTNLDSEIDQINLHINNNRNNLTKMTFNLKESWENQNINRSSNTQHNETNQVSIRENNPKEKRKIVLIDNIDKAENNENQEENANLDLNTQNIVGREQHDTILPHLDFCYSASNERKLLKKENSNNNLNIIASSNEKEKSSTKNTSKQIITEEHRKNFSFGTSYFDRNNEKISAFQNKKASYNNTANIYPKSNDNSNAETNTILSGNNKQQENLNSNTKINSTIINNLNTTVSNKKINPSSTSNKNIIKLESLNRKVVQGSKKLSLQIKTDFIDSVMETIEVNRVAPESTKNSISNKESKFDFNSMNKINTTKNISKNKIEFIANASKENTNELNNLGKTNLNKHRKTYSRNYLSTNLNLDKNGEAQENNESKLKNMEVPKEKETKKASASLDKSIIPNNKFTREASENKKQNAKADLENKEVQPENTKKFLKNLSIINEKENSENKLNTDNIYNLNANKYQKQLAKSNLKNYSFDFINLNTSVENDISGVSNKKQNQTQMKFNTKNKQSKRDEATEKDKELIEDSIKVKKKQTSKEKNKAETEKSKLKDKNDRINNKPNENTKKDILHEKKQTHRLSKSVIIQNKITTEKEVRIDFITQEENDNSERNHKKISEKDPTLINHRRVKNTRSYSIHNNNLILNNLGFDEKNYDKTLNNTKKDDADSATDQLKKRSITNDRRTSLKRNSKGDNNYYLKDDILNESDKNNKKKKAVKNISVLNKASEKDKLTNDSENNSMNNLPKRSILKNNIKKSSLVETEKDINAKRMSITNKIKEEIKSEKENNKNIKSLNGEAKGRVSTSKVRKVIRPSNLKNKNTEDINENLDLEAQEDKNHNTHTASLNNELIKDSNDLEDKTNENSSEPEPESQNYQETRIDNVQFDNLIRNIKIDDIYLFKPKDDKQEQEKEESNIQINLSDNNKLNINEEAYTNQNIHKSNLKEIEKKLGENSAYEIAETSHDKQNNIEFNFNRKITFDFRGEAKNEKNIFDDLTTTPKFSSLINNRYLSEKRLDIVEDSLTTVNNLQQKFNDIQTENTKTPSIPIEDFISGKKKTKKSFGNKKAEVFNLIFNSK